MAATVNCGGKLLLPEFSPALQRRILESYDLPDTTEFRLYSVSHNVTIWVLVPHRRLPRILRIYGNSWKTADMILAELQVLRFVGCHSEIRVPTPIPNCKGELLCVYKGISSDEVRVAMFTYLQGRPLSLCPSKAFALGASVGELDLALQAANEQITPVPASRRLKWDHSALIEWPRQQLLNSDVTFTSPDAGCVKDKAGPLGVDAVADLLTPLFRELYRSLPRQLLHADVVVTNVVEWRRRIGILDFDDMGEGIRIYELAAAICSPPMLAAAKLLAPPLLDGYCSRVSLSAAELEALPLVIAVRLFGSLGWAAAHPDISWTQQVLASGPARLRYILAVLDSFGKRGASDGLLLPICA
jgi:Ser/Thr protein kinase RdoA (MazF antagonist)